MISHRLFLLHFRTSRTENAWREHQNCKIHDKFIFPLLRPISILFFSPKSAVIFSIPKKYLKKKTGKEDMEFSIMTHPVVKMSPCRRKIALVALEPSWQGASLSTSPFRGLIMRIFLSLHVVTSFDPSQFQQAL